MRTGAAATRARSPTRTPRCCAPPARAPSSPPQAIRTLRCLHFILPCLQFCARPPVALPFDFCTRLRCFVPVTCDDLCFLLNFWICFISIGFRCSRVSLFCRAPTAFFILQLPYISFVVVRCWFSVYFASLRAECRIN